MSFQRLMWIVVSIGIVGHAIFGIILCYKQVKNNSIYTFSDEMVKTRLNLQKNYISNIRIVDSSTQCNESETPASGLISQKHTEYNLSYIALENESKQKQILQICQEIHYEYSYATQFKKDSAEQQESYNCTYRGIQIKQSENSNQCPISRIIITQEDVVLENYEKISIPNNTKVNIFIRRSDPDSTPLVGIYLIKTDEVEFPLKQSDSTFTMKDVCKEKYALYEGFCQFDSNPDKLNISIAFENQVSLDSEFNSADILNFDGKDVYLYKQFINKLRYPIALIVGALSAMIIAIFVFLNFESEVQYHTLYRYAYYSVINLIYFYAFYHDFKIINTVAVSTCHLQENFLDNIKNVSQEFIEFLPNYLIAQLILMLTPLIFELHNKLTSTEVATTTNVNKFMRIDQSEMANLSSIEA